MRNKKLRLLIKFCSIGYKSFVTLSRSQIIHSVMTQLKMLQRIWWWFHNVGLLENSSSFICSVHQVYNILLSSSFAATENTHNFTSQDTHFVRVRTGYWTTYPRLDSYVWSHSVCAELGSKLRVYRIAKHYRSSWVRDTDDVRQTHACRVGLLYVLCCDRDLPHSRLSAINSSNPGVNGRRLINWQQISATVKVPIGLRLGLPHLTKTKAR